jgi:hypothetical protein
MTSSELVRLAQRLVSLDHEAEEVRNAMRALLANGCDTSADLSSHPTRARSSKPGKKSAGMNADRVAAAERGLQAIIDVLADGPLPAMEIMSLLGLKRPTTMDRLRRLREQGRAINKDGLWRTIGLTTQDELPHAEARVESVETVAD